jgi:SNF2 family DNA or RNA helicase
MIELNTNRFKLAPFKHQIDGVKALLYNHNFALFDEMGAGKTKQVIDAAGTMFENGMLTTVVVICPAQCKTVWLDPELGEITKHSFVPSVVHDFSSRNVVIKPEIGYLNWIVTSYEFMRQDNRLRMLIASLKQIKNNGGLILLVMDESIFIKNPKAQQAKSCFELRQYVDRAVLLNGTPISNSPLDLYSQFACLDKKILGYKNFYVFRAHHARMGGWMGKQVVGYENLEELQLKLKPFILRRLKSDCLDLPPKLYTQIECPLSDKNWKIYREMKEEMVTWLSQEQAATASQAAVKSLRLSQITSGFLGGLQMCKVEGSEEFELMDDIAGFEVLYTPPAEIGDEKLRTVLNWLERMLEEDRAFRVIIWCRFRAELKRFKHVLSVDDRFTGVKVLSIIGGQTKADRDEAKAEFQAGDVSRPAILLGQPQAGGFGLTLTTAHTVMYVSCDYNLLTRLQSEDRVHRPGQRFPVTYVDVLATGPTGQKTVDHLVVKALRRKEDLAKLTASEWRNRLMEE